MTIKIIFSSYLFWFSCLWSFCPQGSCFLYYLLQSSSLWFFNLWSFNFLPFNLRFIAPSRATVTSAFILVYSYAFPLVFYIFFWSGTSAPIDSILVCLSVSVLNSFSLFFSFFAYYITLISPSLVPISQVYLLSLEDYFAAKRLVS